MCLNTNDPVVYVADEDIEVYKYLSINTRKIRRKGLLGLLGLKKEKTTMQAINTGYEYQIGKPNPQVSLRVYNYSGNISVEEGYHSYVTDEQANTIFVIPKGTKYMKGWCNNETDVKNYVSETIIFKELMNKNK